METAYSIKDEKKFTKSIDMSEYEILTDTGFVDLKYLHETIPYEVWEIETEDGFSLKCADDHIIFDDKMREVFVKDLFIGQSIMTENGPKQILKVENLGFEEPMYDFQLTDESNMRYFTNGILSHNTELAKQITKYLFESEDSLIRLDMSEYMEKISINRIIGSPQGYVGYEDSNVLDKIRRKPYSVILFDEIEKAHPDVFNLFLQMLDDGHMTDSHGRKVSFKNSVILMTSNVGTKMVKEFGEGVGFSTRSRSLSKSDDIKSMLEKELKKKFAPEFINRLDGIVYFNDLGRDEIRKITDNELQKTLTRAFNLGYTLEIDDLLKEQLMNVGYHKEYGARPMKRAIQKWIDDAVTDHIMTESPEQGSIFSMSYDKEIDKTVIKTKKIKKKKTNG